MRSGLLGWGWRHGLLLLVMLVCSAMVGRRLVDLQMIQHDQLQAAARKQYIEVYSLEPQRGAIYDAVIGACAPVPNVFSVRWLPS